MAAAAAPTWVAPATQAAGQAGVGILDNLWKRQGAKQQNKWNSQAADQQHLRNVEMWQWQNLYNHPQQQMARLKEAGLNPNLIYGSGTQAAAGNAGDVKGYDRAEARNVNEGFNAFSEMYRLSNLQAVTDNVKAQEQVAEQEAIKKSYETLNIAMDTKRKSFDLGLSKELRDTSLQTAIANSEIAVQNARRSMADANVSVKTQDPRIKKAQAELNIALSQKKGQDLLNRLREIEINLNKAGVQKSDNVLLRMLMQNPVGRKVMDFLMQVPGHRK